MPLRVPPLRLTDTNATTAMIKTTGPSSPLNNINSVNASPATPVAGE